MNETQLLVTAYRKFLLEIGGELKKVRDNKEYEGVADSFMDFVKSPEIGFTVDEANTLIKMYDMFCLLEPEDLPSHNAMRLMVKKSVDMKLLADAQNLSVTDFKERIKDDEIKTQERTYRYEVIKRTVETGNIVRVYGEELEEAIKSLSND